MIAILISPEPALLRPAPPALIAPAPRQVSFGLVAGRVGAGSVRIAVFVDGAEVASRSTPRGRFRLRVTLPTRDVTVKVVAYGPAGGSSATTVSPVFGLPRAAVPTATRSRLDPGLQRLLRARSGAFPGITGFYVQDLRTGAGAAWNARARFPAASTLKLGIAIEVMRTLSGLPPRGTEVDRRLRSMLRASSNRAANELLVWLSGSTGAGAARVNATLRRAGITDTNLYGGYILGTGVATGRPIPVGAVESPSFGSGKYTTAWDMARMFKYLHLATAGRGPLISRLRGFTSADARRLLYYLAHSEDHGKLDRFVRGPGVAVPHKAGWISTARHDTGLVYSSDGAFVAAVMTWDGSGISMSADRLAGRIAKLALDRFVAAGSASTPRATFLSLRL
jgi:beta-lactamase family protein